MLVNHAKYSLCSLYFQQYSFAGNHAIESSKIEKVMNSIDRKDFISKGHPYEDSPQYIGYGGTISAPHMVLVKSETFKGLP